VASLIANNSASGVGSSGGGLSFGCGGVLSVHNSTLVDNSAVGFGGGLSAGANNGDATCALNLTQNHVGGNTAGGAAQLYHGCTADLAIEESTFNFTTGSQVRVVELYLL
jgi:hypothetical protein